VHEWFVVSTAGDYPKPHDAAGILGEKCFCIQVTTLQRVEHIIEGFIALCIIDIYELLQPVSMRQSTSQASDFNLIQEYGVGGL
jgi:hypothetical protein